MAAQPKATAMEKKNVPNAAEHIDQLVARAKKAQAAFMDMTQEQIDTIVQQMALAGLDKHMHLAKMAVEETGRGVYEDKITKIFLPRSTSSTRLNTRKPSASSRTIRMAHI